MTDFDQFADDLQFFSDHPTFLNSLIPRCLSRKLLRFKKLDSITDATHVFVKSKNNEFKIFTEFHFDKLVRTIYIDDTSMIIDKTMNGNVPHYFLKPKIFSKSSIINHDGLNNHKLEEFSEDLINNQIEIEEKSALYAVINHLWKQNFFLFFLYEIILILNGRYLQPILSMLFSVPFHCFEAFVEKWKLKQLKATIKRDSFEVSVKRSGKWCRINSTHIHVGDIISLSNMSQGVTIPCDILLVTGRCITDESSLDGESTPVVKDPIYDYPDDYVFDELSDSKMHMLFSGTDLKNVENSTDAKNLKENLCYGIVIRTGFNTVRGKIIKQALNSLEASNSNIKIMKQMRPILALLLGIGVCGSIYYYHTANNAEFQEIKLKYNPDSFVQYNLFVQALLIIASIMPSDIQTNIFFILNKGLASLLNHYIYSSEPSNLLLMSNCNVICFDKTGTLTKNDIRIHGIVEFAKLDDNLLKLNQIGPGAQNFDELMSSNLTKTANLFGKDIIAACLGCHQLRYSDKKSMFLGDELERNCMNLVKGTSKCKDKSGCLQVVTSNYSKFSGNLRIHKVFQFSSKLARMSVVLSTDDQPGRIFSIIKGSPEEIFSRQISKIDSFPDITRYWSKKGYRILAFAIKELGNISNESINNLNREDVENDITPIGLIIAYNPLKEESYKIITSLKLDRNITIKLITGDNQFTSISVCNDLGLVNPDKTFEVLSVDSRTGQLLTCAYYESENKADLMTLKISYDIAKEQLTTGIRFYVTGPNLKKLDSLAFKNVVNICTVFARISPSQKGEIIRNLQESGQRSMMVGDGANDIIAMRQAASSFSLSSSETKLINAFNDKKTDEVIPSTTPSSFRTFWNFVSKYSNNDGSSEFSLCTIGSSFFTNSSNPNGLLHILKQSKSSTAFVKYFGLMSISFAVFDFFFTLVTLKSHIKLAESNLMLEAYILLIASTLAMAPSLNVDEKIPNNLSVKSNSLYSLKLGSTFAFSLLADLSILLYFQHYVSLNFSGKCTNDLNMSIISPCKAIFMYLFIMVELLSFYIYYPGKKFIEPINRTKLFKYLFMVIPAILFMAWQGLSPGNAFEPIVQFEFPSDFFPKFLGQIVMNFLIKMTIVGIFKPYD